jgi:hypothetical protein
MKKALNSTPYLESINKRKGKTKRVFRLAMDLK